MCDSHSALRKAELLRHGQWEAAFFALATGRFKNSAQGCEKSPFRTFVSLLRFYEMSLPLQVLERHNRVANYASTETVAKPLKQHHSGLIDEQTDSDKGTFTIHRWRQFVKMFSLIAIPLLGIIATTSIKLNEAADINSVSQISRSTILGEKN